MKEKETTPAPSGETEINTGKFKSAEELLSAYNALEREFTKRCQLISKLQAALSSRDGSQAQAADGGSDSTETECEKTADKSDGADGQINVLMQNEKVKTDAQSEIDTFKKRREATCPDNAAEYAISHAEELSAIPEVMAACIERYKRKIIAAGSVPSPEGMAVIVPAKRPKTLADAKLLADSMLDKF
ncbi:MAG: hypothetical protein J1F39_02785 [Clostridiales bacterium]|nr:hypothetical protein [Clostridiales bacterium]